MMDDLGEKSEGGENQIFIPVLFLIVLHFVSL